MLRLRFAAAVAAGAAVLLLAAGRGLVNYDTLYALVWGRELASGTLPDLEVPIAPTPHPLANLAGIVLSPLSGLRDGGLRGELALDVVVVVAFVALALLGWVVFALGRAWFDAWVGAVAAAIVLTRVPVLDFGARAYVDLPYLVLVLAALLVETRRPRAGAPVLVLLALAGLLRPEAWLFSAAYVAWLALGRDRAALRELAPLAALAAAGPVLWALSDLALTGNALHSLTGTRDNAEVLQRVTGLDEVPATMPRRLGEILREAALLAAAGGGVLALAWRRTRGVRLGAAAGVLALAAFCVLAAAGLPIITRYLLLTAALLCVFAGAGVFGWRSLPRGPRRTWWSRFGLVALLVLLVFVPDQVGRIGSLRDALRVQSGIQADLGDTVRAGVPCEPVAVPNRRPVPLLALWLDLRPQALVDAQAAGVPSRGTYVVPRTPQVAQDFILDRRDLRRDVAPPPPGYGRRAATASWLLTARC